MEPHLLLSGAADGLLSISNILEHDEDEAVVHMVNWGCSIARAGWYKRRASTGSHKEETHGQGKTTDWQVWSASDMETFALWTPEASMKSIIRIVLVLILILGIFSWMSCTNMAT